VELLFARLLKFQEITCCLNREHTNLVKACLDALCFLEDYNNCLSTFEFLFEWLKTMHSWNLALKDCRKVLMANKSLLYSDNIELCSVKVINYIYKVVVFDKCRRNDDAC